MVVGRLGLLACLVAAAVAFAYVFSGPGAAQPAASASFAAALEHRYTDAAAKSGEHGHADGTDNVVLGGVDVVAYFSLEAGAAPVWGKADYATAVTSVDGLDGNSFQSVFWFATAENARLFEASPSKYAPRFGGFCSYGMSSEFARGGEAPMASANATSGWAWAKDYVGPPANQSVWAVRDGKLYLAFLQPVMDVFLDDYDVLSAVAEGRWATFYGTSLAAPTGPFNTECLASGYRATPTRTCTFNPQKLAGILSPKALEDDCADQLNATCGAYRGDDPVAGAACSKCLTEHAAKLGSVCPAAYDGTLQTRVDKAYCW